MEAQDVSQPPAAVVVAPPLRLTQHGTHNCSSAPPASNNASFVKALDKKARSYLKMLECSLSFSTSSSKNEDPSAMTIEFLRVRLQAQRAEYKAEKQRAQHLAKKVLELERRLKFEERGKSAALTSMDNPCDFGPRCRQCRRYSGERITDRKNIDLQQLVKRGMPRQDRASESVPFAQSSQDTPAIHDLSASTSATRWHINLLADQPHTQPSISCICEEDSNVITEC